MLVLNRESNEEVYVDINPLLATYGIPPVKLIRVIMVEIRGKKARLGFDAPAQVEIHRKEVWERMQGAVLEHRDQSDASERRGRVMDGKGGD